MEAGATVATLNAESAGARIETRAGASIGTANVAAQIEITGAGSIAVANISANGVVIEMKPTTTNVAADVAADVGGATVGSTATTETPSTPSAPSGGGSGGGGGGGGQTATPITAATAGDGSFSVRGVNYVLLSVTAGDYERGVYTINGTGVTPSKVLADGSLIKLTVPAGETEAALSVTQGGRTVLTENIAFDGPGEAAPVTLYGTVPMTFSEFFHDITANINEVEPAVTAFETNGTVARPVKFITQGTRTGAAPSGLTYAQGDALEKVDVISSATYGDDVHFVPNGNLELDGSDRKTKTDPNAAILGIKKVEAGISFDLFANAFLLSEIGKGTAQSANVLAKASKLDIAAIKYADDSFKDAAGAAISAPPIYKPKHMLTDGNWGERAGTALNADAAKPLPGDAAEMENVAYNQNWGDKVTGVSFGVAAALGPDYSGANYWDNFAEYIYGGYIEDGDGHREPLVFLQNIFSHRMHEDFDIAISPSRFARLANLKTPDTYKVRVYAYGFEDVEVEVHMDHMLNESASMSPVSITAEAGGPDKDVYISGIDDFDAYDAALFSLTKGAAPVPAADYAVAKEGGKLKLTLKSSLFTGAFQGAYTVRLAPDPAAGEGPAKVTFALTLIKLIERPSLTADAGLTGGVAATEGSPFAVAKSDGKIYFTDAEFASALIVAPGRGSTIYTSIKEAGAEGPAAVIGDAAARDGAGQPYYLDLSNGVFEPGKTYEITAFATNISVSEPAKYYVKVERRLAEWAGTWNSFGDRLNSQAVENAYASAAAVSGMSVAGLKAMMTAMVDLNVSAAAVSGDSLTLHTGALYGSGGLLSGGGTSNVISGYTWEGDVSVDGMTWSKFVTEDPGAAGYKYLLLSEPEIVDPVHWHIRYGGTGYDDLIALNTWYGTFVEHGMTDDVAAATVSMLLQMFI
jgi:Zn/Cd-binding protein ZinT